MKKLRKIGAIVLAVMMIAVMATAWADGNNVWTGSDNDSANPGLATDDIAGTTTIPLNKTIVIFNTEDGTTVREPDISFSYAITKVDTQAADGAQLSSTVTDEDSNTVNVYNGVPAGITNPSNISYSHSNTVTATTTGYEDEKSTNITVDPTKFPHAGIYRYKITETAGDDPEDVGMEDRTSNYDSTRYLDVYIYNPDYDDSVDPPTGHPTLWLGAAVIFKTVASTGNEGTDNINTSFEKTTGFEPADNDDGSTDFTNDETVDRYFTYNVEVTKAITGTLADKNHDFPFQISFTGALEHAVTVDVTNSSANPANTTLSISDTAATDSAALHDGESYTVTGLPKGTTVTVKEYNDTLDTYKLTTNVDGSSSDATYTTATVLKTTASEAMGETNVAIDSDDDTTVKADANTVLTFTNDLASISPTGYVARFAPYALILIGGIALLIISRKHKKHTDEE